MVKSGVDALELRAGDEGSALVVPKGKYGVEVVAIRSPKAGAVPDYVCLVRDELPTEPGEARRAPRRAHPIARARSAAVSARRGV